MCVCVCVCVYAGVHQGMVLVDAEADDFKRLALPIRGLHGSKNSSESEETRKQGANYRGARGSSAPLNNTWAPLKT